MFQHTPVGSCPVAVHLRGEPGSVLSALSHYVVADSSMISPPFHYLPLKDEQTHSS